MIVRVRVVPFSRPRDRAARLPGLVLVGLAVLVVAVWNPVANPGPKLCMSRVVFGIPCPLCGGTRGAALALRGHPLEALAYNPLSLPALAFAFALILLWSGELLGNKYVHITCAPWLRRALKVALFASFAATWVYLLCYRREDDFASSLLGWIIG